MHSTSTSVRTQTKQPEGQDKAAALHWFNDLPAPEWDIIAPAMNNEFERMDENAILNILHKSKHLSDGGKVYVLDQVRQTRELGKQHKRDNVLAE